MTIDTGSQGGFPEKEEPDDEMTTGTTLGTTDGTTTGTTTGDGHPPRVIE
jgi:hypothetical protein